jgi:hypothetical protein
VPGALGPIWKIPSGATGCSSAARCLRNQHHPLAARAQRELDDYLRLHEGLLDHQLLVDR